MAWVINNKIKARNNAHPWHINRRPLALESAEPISANVRWIWPRSPAALQSSRLVYLSRRAKIPLLLFLSLSLPPRCTHTYTYIATLSKTEARNSKHLRFRIAASSHCCPFSKHTYVIHRVQYAAICGNIENLRIIFPSISIHQVGLLLQSDAAVDDDEDLIRPKRKQMMKKWKHIHIHFAWIL